MKVAISQPNYLPWRGYLDLVDDVDQFILLNDVQYTERDWRNRNRIKTSRGALWLTVPVLHGRSEQSILETRIDNTRPWRRKHLGAVHSSYAKAPFFSDYFAEFEAVLSQRFDYLWELDLALTRWLMEKLGIRTPLTMASDLNARERKGDRILELVGAVGASSYLSGPSAEAYLDVERFAKAGIGLEYKSYDYAEYPQLWGDFEPALSIVDLLFNCGERARPLLKSRTPNRVVSTPDLQRNDTRS